MAKIDVGICPSCGKERQLSFFQFGVIKSTMCVYCLNGYLEKCVIPAMNRNNDTASDKNILEDSYNERTK